MQSFPTVFVIGEILFDVFPTYTRMGGAPFNFAYHMKQCGFPVYFVSRIGKDPYGRLILEELERCGFRTDLIQRDEDLPTGTVQVSLDADGVPEFDITANVAYDHIEFDGRIHQEFLDRSSLLYFGTLAQRSRHGFRNFQQFFSHRPVDTRCFYDINLRPECYTETIIGEGLRQADILKLNEDELQVCRQIERFEGDDRALIDHLIGRYHLNALALTRGEHGSALYTTTAVHTAAPEPIPDLMDTVGAGDGFAAMLAAGMLLSWPPDKALARASGFASRICGIKGAIPDTADFYATCRKQVHQGA